MMWLDELSPWNGHLPYVSLQYPVQQQQHKHQQARGKLWHKILLYLLA
jgi:hypothetical protein